MNPFIIEYFKEKPYVAVLIVTTHENPLLHLQNIERDFGCKIEKGIILIDLLLHSGNNEDRFIEIEYTGLEFNFSTMKKVKIDRANPVRKKTSELLTTFPDVIESSILNSQQKKLILHGICI